MQIRRSGILYPPHMRDGVEVGSYSSAVLRFGMMRVTLMIAVTLFRKCKWKIRWREVEITTGTANN